MFIILLVVILFLALFYPKLLAVCLAIFLLLGAIGLFIHPQPK
jgi:hypothetical protein